MLEFPSILFPSCVSTDQMLHKLRSIVEKGEFLALVSIELDQYLDIYGKRGKH